MFTFIGWDKSSAYHNSGLRGGVFWPTSHHVLDTTFLHVVHVVYAHWAHFSRINRFARAKCDGCECFWSLIAPLGDGCAAGTLPIFELLSTPVPCALLVFHLQICVGCGLYNLQVALLLHTDANLGNKEARVAPRGDLCSMVKVSWFWILPPPSCARHISIYTHALPASPSPSELRYR